MVNSMHTTSSKKYFPAGVMILIIFAALASFIHSNNAYTIPAAICDNSLSTPYSNAYIDETDTYISIGNDNIELGFDKQTGGGLDKILDKAKCEFHDD